MSYSVTIQGLEELLARLDIKTPLKDGLEAAGVYFVKKMKFYPKTSGKPQPFKTDKSRRWFFANLNDGNIPVPYQRTMALRNRWTHAVNSGGDAVMVGNNTPYAKLVQGRDDQSPYHSGTWATAEDKLDDERAKLSEIIAMPIREHLGGGK